jgi:hypothetical protein
MVACLTCVTPDNYYSYDFPGNGDPTTPPAGVFKNCNTCADGYTFDDSSTYTSGDRVCISRTNGVCKAG